MAATRPQVQSGALKRYFAEHRVLEVYPTGLRRWWMLLLTVFATVVSFYEFGFSALLPLWLPSLHFTREEFGWFLTRQWQSGQQDGPHPISYGFDYAWRLALRAVSISNN